MQVIKRDKSKQEFNIEKIKTAITKACRAVNENPDTVLTYSFIVQLQNTINKFVVNDEIDIEDIQNTVEDILFAKGYIKLGKAYVKYREEHHKIRNGYSNLIQKIYDRLHAINIENANANVDENSFSGREKEALSDLQKYLAFEAGGVSKLMADCHNQMLIYQHDSEKTLLGQHNCLFLDFKQIFENGFVTRNGDVRPPSNFSTACQLVAVAFQCESQVQFGGVGSVHIDYDLAPFVKKSYSKHFKDGLKYVSKAPQNIIDKVPKDLSLNSNITDNYSDAKQYALDMLNKEGKQACQGLYHNLNTLESRAGSQVPFTSINFGRDTSLEGQLVSKWLMEASIDGIGKHHLTSIFPISIFQYKTNVNAKEGDPNYHLKKLALESMSKRIYPNWCNCNWSEAHEDINNPDTYFATMGCRTLIGYDRHGLGYTRVGRGNNVPNTIILPKLGIEYGICLGTRTEPDIKGFWLAFEDTLNKCEKTLLERFEIMKNQNPNVAPFLYQNNLIKGATSCDATVYNALKHNTLAIGYIGIAEMCTALFGKNHVYDTDVHKFALSVVERINKFAKEASERNNLNFSCYATPAEGLCHTALKSLRKQYGIIPNVTSHEFLTNSHHVPVWEKVSIYDKLKIEAPFCKYPTGGCITYIELDSTFVKNTKAIEDIIDYAFNALDIPYLTFNFPIDSCLTCGHQGEFNDKCPECQSSNICQLRRVTGYLTSDYNRFNKGKFNEVNERIKHSLYES